MNERVRRFVYDFADDGDENLVGKVVLLADFAAFMEEFLIYNGHQMGYNTTTQSYKLDAMRSQPGQKQAFPSGIVLMCGKRVEVGAENCTQNMVYYDGMHTICPGIVGPRLMRSLHV